MTQETANFDHNIPAYCIIKQINEPNTILVEYEEETEKMSVTKDLKHAHAGDMLC